MSKQQEHPLLAQTTKLLQALVRTPSVSGQEGATAAILTAWLQQKGAIVRNLGNNVIARGAQYNPNQPTLILNSHHDTVKANTSYTKSAYEATLKEGKLYGLGSTDAGGALCCLTSIFVSLLHAPLPFNLVLIASAEEETSGKGGLELVIKSLPDLDLRADMAIVGEPTSMEVAVAQKGLIVLDCVNFGQAGHAARNNGQNALYAALEDIVAVRNLVWDRISSWLGRTLCQTTMIQAGTAHNQVPDRCEWVIDVRPNECYELQEVVEIIQSVVSAEVKPRSLRLKPQSVDLGHPLVLAAQAIGATAYGSPTMSDWTFMPCPAIKIGPGDTLRSHTADEYILIEELNTGLNRYQSLILKLAELTPSAKTKPTLKA